MSVSPPSSGDEDEDGYLDTDEDTEASRKPLPTAVSSSRGEGVLVGDCTVNGGGKSGKSKNVVKRATPQGVLNTFFDGEKLVFLHLQCRGEITGVAPRGTYASLGYKGDASHLS